MRCEPHGVPGHRRAGGARGGVLRAAVADGRPGAVESAFQQPYRLDRDVPYRLPHRGDGRVGEVGGRYVVEAGHGDLAGYVDAELPQPLDDAECDEVVAADHGVRRPAIAAIPLVPEPVDGLAAPGGGEVAEGEQRRFPGGECADARLVGGAAFRGGRGGAVGADVAGPAAASRGEVVEHERHSGGVVDGDEVGDAGPAAAVEQDEGDACGGCGDGGPAAVFVDGDHEQRVDLPGQQGFDPGGFLVRVVVAVDEQYGPSALVQDVGQLPDERRVEGVGDLGEDESDGGGAPAAQGPRDLVGPVAEAFGGLADPAGGAGADGP
ncbi:hypothetical protein STAL104432_30225 [Streptomyces albus]